MPTIFRTKTISDILDPVAQQIAKLLIYDEEAANGLPVQDLSKSVSCVSNAVENLLEIGSETCKLIKEKNINHNLASALNYVKVSCQELMKFCENSKIDPQVTTARNILIESAKGILQGTSALLIALDDLEIEKTVAICRLVMSYLNKTEDIKIMDELLKFVQNLSPALTKMAAAVFKRSENLTHKMHRDILSSCLDTVKALSPILVCGLKIYVQLLEQGNVNLREARENRDYMLRRVRNEINEIIRVVQLCLENDYQYTVQFGTETIDDFSVIQKSLKAIGILMPTFYGAARQMEDVEKTSKSLMCIVENAEYIAYRSCIEDAEPIRRTCKEILELQKSLNMPCKSEIVVENLQTKLNSLFDPVDGRGLLKNAMLNVKKSRYSHSPYSNLDDSGVMVSSLEKSDVGKAVAVEAIKNITAESRQIVQQNTTGDQKYVTHLCDRIDYLTDNIDRQQKKTADIGTQTNTPRSLSGHSSMLISHVLSGGLCPFELTSFYDISPKMSSKIDQRKTLFRSKSADLRPTLCIGHFRSYSTTTFDNNDTKIAPKHIHNLSHEFNTYKETETSKKLPIQIPKVSDLASELKQRLTDLNGAMGKLLVDKIVENFVDIWTPVKSFVSTVRHSEDGAKIVCDSSSDQKLRFGEKSRFLRDHVTKCVQTARLVSRAVADSGKYSQTSKKLNDSANNVQDSIVHLINIGKVLHSCPMEKYVDQLFLSVFQQFQQNFSSMRQLIDEVIDSMDFVRASGRAVEKCCNLCEIAIRRKNMQIFVANTAHIVKLCNRIVDKVDCELQNTDDHAYIESVKNLVNRLQNAMLKGMQTAKRMALKLTENDVFKWNDLVKEILQSITQIQRDLLGRVPVPESDMHQKTSKSAQTCASRKMKRYHSLNDGKSASIRRPSWDAGYSSDTNARVVRSLPEHKRGGHVSLSVVDIRDQFSCHSCKSNFGHKIDLKDDSVIQNGDKINNGIGNQDRSVEKMTCFHDSSAGAILSHVTTSRNYSYLDRMKDNENLEAMWERVPLARQHKQIFDGARDLHNEVTQWSTKHNDMVAAAVRVSLLMAKLSQLVWCEIGSKKELIACSKAVANASEEVTEIAFQMAVFCTDLKIRKMLRQACEKVPTAATQLKILSTVKATMVDCPDRKEVEEAMRQLVFNAENLMKCVKNTVKIAETASLKIQTDTGLRLRWIQKSATT